MRTRNTPARHSGYTLVEMMVGAVIFSLMATALLVTWTALGTSALNTIEFCQTQNDQMRTFDYLKRDIRRATAVAIYNGATLVTGTNNWGSTMQLTIPKYYADSNQEDSIGIGPSVATSPTLVSGVVTYGTPLTVQYYATNGVIIHNESGTTRNLSDGGATYTLSFCNDPSGMIHCRISYTQTMRSGTNRQLSRQVDLLVGQRSTVY